MRKRRTCLRPHSWFMSGPELEPQSVLSQNVILSRTVYYLPCFIPLFEGKKVLNSGKSINYQYLLSPTMIKASMEKHRSIRHKPATTGYRHPGKMKRTFTYHVEHEGWATKEIINAPGSNVEEMVHDQFMARGGLKEKAGFQTQMKRRTAPGS